MAATFKASYTTRRGTIVGHVCELFSEDECHNFFKAAGYETE